MDDAGHHRLDRPLGRGERDRHVVRPHQAIADPADRSEEAHHEAVGRGVVDLARGAHLLDRALVHDRDPVGHLHRLLLVVGDQDGGDALLVVQAPQPLPQFGPHRGVEGAERFVEQQHARLHGQRPRERHPLALAA
jgi:hypothetical protein